MKRKIVCLTLIFVITLSLFNAAFGDEEKKKIVNIECPNLEKALKELTEKDELTEFNLGELDGDIDLTQKGITSLVGIEYLDRVDNLILTGNNITDITPLYALDNLEELSVNYNHIENIPVGLNNLKSLKHLDISQNPLKSLPQDINDFESLKWLCIDYCGLNEINDLSGLSDTLEWLVMPGNPVNDYSFISDLTKLELINLSQCNLDEVPNLSKNIELRYLYLTNNQLTELPSYLSNFNIHRLDASFNYLNDIPDDYANFSRMEQLVLTNNFFRTFPVEAFEFENLIVLMLGQNLLTDIPVGLSDLADLKRLSFTSNDLISLETYSEFVIPYSYQLGLSYNRLDLSDVQTQEILKENHNTGGIQKTGEITLDVVSADTEGIHFAINDNLNTFIELKDFDYELNEVYIFDNNTADKSLVKVIDDVKSESGKIHFEVNDNLQVSQKIDWQVLLSITVPTWPETELYYYTDVVIDELKAPATTPSPAPNEEKIITAEESDVVIYNNAKVNFDYFTIILLSILGLAIIILVVIIIRRVKK